MYVLKVKISMRVIALKLFSIEILNNFAWLRLVQFDWSQILDY